MTQFTARLDGLTRDLAKAHGSTGMAKTHPVGARIGSARPLAKALTPEPEAISDNIMSGEVFMAKALESVGRGHITTTQLTNAEFRLREGKLPDPQVVKAVLTGTKYWPF